jgi:D-glycero-D-manno-heptose 1,7-bisphosphate phosphatase
VTPSPLRPTTAFLDRDGTINRAAAPGDYIKSWSEFEFLPRAPEAIARLNELGLRVVVVTNQRGIALGRMREDDVVDIHRRMTDALNAAGARLDAIYYCPHDVGECDCRKPAVGMLERARRDIPGIELRRSVVIGDSESDMEAAARVGADRILISNDDAYAGDAGNGTRASSLWDAVGLVAEAVPR